MYCYDKEENKMDEKYARFLPIGTVVLLKNATKKLMITGFCSYDKGNKENPKAFDYTGCLYPEGIISSDQMALFNHSQIAKIYHLGMRDEEEIKFKKVLNEELAKATAKNQSTNTNQNQ